MRESKAWKVGDVIIVEGGHVGDLPRMGEILEILGTPSHPHFAVRWDDGRETILYPSDDVTLRHAHPHK